MTKQNKIKSSMRLVHHGQTRESIVVKTRELTLSLLQKLGETGEISHIPKWNQTTHPKSCTESITYYYLSSERHLFVRECENV